MPNILAIDSSTEACSVALDLDGHLFSRFQIAPRKHAELLLPMVDDLLKESEAGLKDLDAIACCVGPGAFTGLRIAISVVQGLSYASNLNCIAISSLRVLAAEAFIRTDANICIASIDARMQEVYFAVFKRGDNGYPIEVLPAEVISAENIIFSDELLSLINASSSKGAIAKVGTGWEEYQYSEVIEKITTRPVEIKYPNAKMMLTIAQEDYKNKKLLKAESLQPVYLRNNVAKKKSQQK